MRFLSYRIKRTGFIFKFSLFFSLILIVFDRFYKFLAINGFLDQPIKVIGDLLTLSFSKNYYIAFSVPITGWGLNALIVLILFTLIYSLLNLLIKKKI